MWPMKNYTLINGAAIRENNSSPRRYLRSILLCAIAYCSLVLSATLNAACIETIPQSTPNSQLQDNGDGTVTDLGTGLMWRQCSLGQLPDTSCSGGDSYLYTWDQALSHADDVNFAGYTDWRLPNIKELYSLVEVSCSSPAINSERFPNTSSSQAYWSATAYDVIEDYFYSVRFNVGRSGISIRNLPVGFVRLVRGGQ